MEETKEKNELESVKKTRNLIYKYYLESIEDYNRAFIKKADFETGLKLLLTLSNSLKKLSNKSITNISEKEKKIIDIKIYEYKNQFNRICNILHINLNINDEIIEQKLLLLLKSDKYSDLNKELSFTFMIYKEYEKILKMLDLEIEQLQPIEKKVKKVSYELL